jgi:hypothetical protein
VTRCSGCQALRTVLLAPLTSITPATLLVSPQPVERWRSTTVICIHCGNEEGVLCHSVCDRADYSCSNCGDYSVSVLVQRMIKNGHADPRLARLVAENGRRYLRPSPQ